MASETLTTDQIQMALESLDGWSLTKDGKLHREYVFGTFNEAFGFMTRAAMEIEKVNHHPEWSNTYNRLVVELITHDACGITRNDTGLATVLNSLYGTR